MATGEVRLASTASDPPGRAAIKRIRNVGGLFEHGGIRGHEVALVIPPVTRVGSLDPPDPGDRLPGAATHCTKEPLDRR